MDDVPTDKPTRRRIDVISAMMSMITVVSIMGFAWLRYGPRSASERTPVADLAMDAEAPPLRLLDLKTSEPLVLFGLNDRVVWVVFWSAGAPSGRECLTELEPAWKRLRAHRRFAMVTAAVEANDPARVRTLVESTGVDLPVYLASLETQGRFQVQGGDPPLHVVIDAGGRVIAMARQAGRPTIERIADQVRRRLDELDPIGDSRFASGRRRAD
jgi:hypothetical protein